jgi:hypothetical protein
MSTPPKTDEEFEQIEAMASDDKKVGISATKEIVTAEQKKDKEKEAFSLELLSKKSKNRQSYIKTLTQLLQLKLFEDQLPSGVSYRIALTDRGVYMELYVRGRMFAQAFKVTGEPVYDLNAVDVFVMRTENTIQKLCSRPKEIRS